MKIDFGFRVAALAACLALAAVAEVPANVHLGPAGPSNHGTQGYLGIDVRDVNEESVSSLHLHEARGAEIIRVDHDGPAGKMGLREHDVVLQMNGTAIEGQEPLRRMLHDLAPGRTVTLVISRDGQQMTLSAQMADKLEVERQAYEQHLGSDQHLGSPDAQAPAQALPTGETGNGSAGSTSGPLPASRYSKSFLGTLLMSPSYTGATLDTMGTQLADFFGCSGGGLLVRSVAVNSPAAMAGLRAGDIVTKTNLQPVGSLSHWSKTIREAKGRPVSVTILRDRQEKTLTLLPDSKKRSDLELPADPSQPNPAQPNLAQPNSALGDQDVYIVARRGRLGL